MSALTEIMVTSEFSPIINMRTLTVIARVSDKSLNLPRPIQIKMDVRLLSLRDNDLTTVVHYMMRKIAIELILWEGVDEIRIP